MLLLLLLLRPRLARGNGGTNILALLRVESEDDDDDDKAAATVAFNGGVQVDDGVFVDECVAATTLLLLLLFMSLLPFKLETSFVLSFVMMGLLTIVIVSIGALVAAVLSLLEFTTATEDGIELLLLVLLMTLLNGRKNILTPLLLSLPSSNSLSILSLWAFLLAIVVIEGHIYKHLIILLLHERTIIITIMFV